MINKQYSIIQNQTILGIIHSYYMYLLLILMQFVEYLLIPRKVMRNLSLRVYNYMFTLLCSFCNQLLIMQTIHFCLDTILRNAFSK